jgi:enoyl-[acyl-carrier-protein] reductase (NADH)
MAGRFEGKRGLITGVANRRSIAWAIARVLAEGGAQLAFTYQGERIEKNVRELADSVGSPLVTACDVRSDEDIDRVFSEVGETFGGQRRTSRAASRTHLAIASGSRSTSAPTPSSPAHGQRSR